MNGYLIQRNIQVDKENASVRLSKNHREPDELVADEIT